MKPRVLTYLVLPLLLTGCATPPPPVVHDTPSGKVETTFHGVSKAAVKERLTNQMINAGYTIVRSDDTQLVCDRPIKNVFAAVAFGSRFNSQPDARAAYILIQNENNVRVIADVSVVTNPGSAFENKPT